MDPSHTTNVIEAEDGETTVAVQNNHPTEGNQDNIQIDGSGSRVDLGSLRHRHQNDAITRKVVVHTGNNNAGVNANYYGNVYFNENVSFFGSLAMCPPERDLTETGRATLVNKARYQAGKQLPKLETSSSYSPYARVKNRRIKVRLLQIAQRFQFLDRGFAEYFQVVVPSFNRGQVQQLLREARESIASRQSRGSDQVSDSESLYLGDLGDFCETTMITWDNPSLKPGPKFVVTHRRDHEILHYLQDAFEVPYWELMSDLFLGWRVNSKSLSGEVVLRVLDSQTIDLRDDLRRLHGDLALLQMDDKEHIQPILKGIDERLAVLRSVLDSTTSNPEGREDFLLSVFENRHHGQSTTTTEESLSSRVDELTTGRKEAVVLIALINLFLIGAILPGYKAFAISMKSDEIGSTGDADFWYLVQSSIMSVLGNLISVVPLLKKSWFSPAHNVMWLFFTLGLAFSAVSIGIYPLLNTGWSSIVSFLGSVSSVASVLVITQATGNDRGKVKVD